jgi:glycine/D-amino acid oxidase-like deaminating enzyme
MSVTSEQDVIVVGGGLIGIASALGLRQLGLSVLLLDEGDVAHRAARGNFGLVWLQSKGGGSGDYVRWTRRSIDHWPDFSRELTELTGIDLGYRRPGGYHLCLSDKEFASRSAMVDRIAPNQPDDAKTVMLDASEVRQRIDGVGEGVVGASYNELDGDCNSLALFRALHEGFNRLGGRYKPSVRVDAVERDGAAYRVRTGEDSFGASKVVFAAGLGLNRFAGQVGMPDIVRPQRGQIIVTERLRPFLSMVFSQIRQLPNGTVLIGDTKEDAGFDNGTTSIIMRELAERAVKTLPHLANVNIVRAWGALRVLTHDGLPCYEEAPDWPGVFFATSHSAVTLAPGHAREFARWVAFGEAPPDLLGFSSARFRAAA